MGPQKTVKALSNEQEEAIRNLIREEVRRVRNTQQRGREGAVDHEEFPAPEVYIALAPHGGIAAVTVGEFETGTGTGTGTGTTFGDDVPGSAICQIYYLHDDGTLKMIDGEVKRIYNANRTRIQAGSWVIVVRDKLETWWAVGPVIGGESTAVSVCEELTVVTNVCLDFLGTGTGTSGQIDAVVVEYSTYNLTNCELVDRWCVRNPMACCLTCSGIDYPQRFYATFTLVDGPACACADGVEMVLDYQGTVTNPSHPQFGSHWWTSVMSNFGTCTLPGGVGQLRAKLDLYLNPTGCSVVQNLYLGNNSGTVVCHNNTNGVAYISTAPLHLQGEWPDQIACSPNCDQQTGDILRVDYTV